MKTLKKTLHWNTVLIVTLVCCLADVALAIPLIAVLNDIGSTNKESVDLGEGKRALFSYYYAGRGGLEFGHEVPDILRGARAVVIPINMESGYTMDRDIKKFLRPLFLYGKPDETPVWILGYNMKANGPIQNDLKKAFEAVPLEIRGYFTSAEGFKVVEKGKMLPILRPVFMAVGDSLGW